MREHRSVALVVSASRKGCCIRHVKMKSELLQLDADGRDRADSPLAPSNGDEPIVIEPHRV